MTSNDKELQEVLRKDREETAPYYDGLAAMFAGDQEGQRKAADTIAAREAAKAAKKSKRKAARGRKEAELADVLDQYTNPAHPKYDPLIDEELRTIRPDWFDEKGGN